MDFKTSEPIPEKWKNAYFSLLDPVVTLFTSLGIHPNTFTTVSFLLGGLAAYLMAIGHYRWGAVIILLSGILDTLDGRLARHSGKVTRFGALYDSAMDRYSEVIFFFGMAYFFIDSGYYLPSIGVAIGLGGSLMVSYVRARAEGLGIECKVGIMQRPLRLLVLGAGGIIGVKALVVAIWIVAVLSNLTAIQRILHVWHWDQGKYTDDNT